MNKQDLINVLAESADVSQAAATRALDALLDAITADLKKGNDVAIIGFGSFAPTKRAARAGRNPQTGATIQIAAANSVRFKVGKKLKDAVNDK